MNILSLIGRNGLARFLSKRANVPLETVVRVMDVADLGLARLSAPSVLDIARSDDRVSLLRRFYETYLKDEATWPVVASVISNFLASNDPKGELVPLFAIVAELPFDEFVGDFQNVEDFLVRGVFPLLKKIVGSADSEKCPHCSKELDSVGSGDGRVFICSNCEEVYYEHV